MNPKDFRKAESITFSCDKDCERSFVLSHWTVSLVLDLSLLSRSLLARCVHRLLRYVLLDPGRVHCGGSHFVPLGNSRGEFCLPADLPDKGCSEGPILVRLLGLRLWEEAVVVDPKVEYLFARRPREAPSGFLLCYP